ncbi:Integral membrane protein (Precursor) [Propionibacterium freudenreichii]|nr:Integral membrane protein (Precursor) [Propionibacterium freudenreichii]
MSQPGHGVELADDAHRSPRPPSTTGSLRRELVAIGLVAALVALIGLTPLLTNSHFYWYDDSAGGAYGQWFELGRQISHGHWPLLNPSAWMAGNYTVEQFGLLNPVVIVIGLITQLVSNAAVMATGVKLFFMMVGGAGVYALARQFGARRCFAVMAGVAASLGGFTLFLDATSWVTNLEVWAYFPWVLWGLWRFIVQKKSYWPAFAAGYLTITVAYVQGTVMVVFAFVAFLIWCAIRRTASRALRTVLAGLPMGLLTLALYLPAVLTAGVTVRQGNGVLNNGNMALTLNGLAVSAVPFANPDMQGVPGSMRYALVPATYIAWFLPLLVLCSWPAIRRAAHRMQLLFILGALMLALALGPSDLGPLRFPIRTMPWLVTMVVVVAAVFFSAALRPRAWSRRRLAAALLVTFAGHLLAASQQPSSWAWQLASCAVLCGVTAGIWAWGRARSLASTRADEAAWLRRVCALVIALSCVITAVQAAHFTPGLWKRFGASGFPSHVASLEKPLPGARGTTLVVGPFDNLQTGFWTASTVGNLAYLSASDVMNLYSPSGFQAFGDDLCMQSYYGKTCYEAIDRLFSGVSQADGTLLVDLLGIDSIQVLANKATSIDTLQARFPTPTGWRLTNLTDRSFTWQRDTTSAPAGSPSWASPGLRYSVVSQGDTQVRLHIDAVGAQGGTIAFSRLAWPGYTVTGASLATPLRDYLLAVDVPATAAGTDVTITFRPPGWTLEIAAFALAWALALGIAVTRFVRRRRGGHDDGGPAAIARTAGADSAGTGRCRTVGTTDLVPPRGTRGPHDPVQVVVRSRSDRGRRVERRRSGQGGRSRPAG